MKIKGFFSHKSPYKRWIRNRIQLLRRADARGSAGIIYRKWRCRSGIIIDVTKLVAQRILNTNTLPQTPYLDLRRSTSKGREGKEMGYGEGERGGRGEGKRKWKSARPRNYFLPTPLLVFVTNYCWDSLPSSRSMVVCLQLTAVTADCHPIVVRLVCNDKRTALGPVPSWRDLDVEPQSAVSVPRQTVDHFVSQPEVSGWHAERISKLVPRAVKEVWVVHMLLHQYAPLVRNTCVVICKIVSNK